jgi:hypothetical protein
LVSHLPASSWSKEWGPPSYDILSKEVSSLNLADVAAKLHATNQGKTTLQTMVFEPTTLKLHLAIGKCPTSALPLQPLEVGPLFRGER